MHEPSSRPHLGRESDVGWKTVSVEGHLSGFKVSGFQSFKESKMLAAEQREMSLKLWNSGACETSSVDDVQPNCYDLMVPRVKSGLPVSCSLPVCAACVGGKLRENLG
jgi:hypothetical protein